MTGSSTTCNGSSEPPLADLSRSGKQQAVRLLEEAGAFSYRKSVEAVAASLGVSRFTVKSYLNREVNEMTRDQFVDTFGKLFQGPAWVTERAYDQRPFGDRHDLRVSFQKALFSAGRGEQPDLMTFYPDLGSDAAEGEVRSEASARDRGAAGLALLNCDDHEQFAKLTQAYRERFGIPLIVSVRDVEPAR